jgi:hypothetical protein
MFMAPQTTAFSTYCSIIQCMLRLHREHVTCGLVADQMEGEETDKEKLEAGLYPLLGGIQLARGVLTSLLTLILLQNTILC